MFSSSDSLVFSICTLLVYLLFSIPNTSAQPYVCLPNCATSDARNFIFTGQGQDSFIDNAILFALSSPEGSATIEIGIFDGDDGISQGGVFSDWDLFESNIRVTLYADPTGQGEQTIMLGQWSGNGTFGNNNGNPMPDNDWFNIVIINSLQAVSPNGNYRYTLLIDAETVTNQSRNSFSVRTDGTMIILPFQTFGFMANSQTNSDFFAIYPNATDGPECFDFVANDFVCSFSDPECCASGGPYDGSWNFYVDVPVGQGVFNIWDGDFDLGSSTFIDAFTPCQINGIDQDTDDPNTPNEVPVFALGTDAVAESASLNPNPPDDVCINSLLRKPSVFYTVTTPSGQTFTNDNPSGTEEWELFLVSTQGGGDVDLPSIEEGFWRISPQGVDMVNLNAFRLDFPVLALDENDNPVDFDPPLTPIPTLNEWGLITLALMGLIISVLYLKRRRASEI